MSTSPQAAAGTARQRLAGVLGTLQQDPNLPPSVLEIVSGLARAIGPLFQLERGSQDHQLLGQARGVLQETLEKMQGVDQNYPGIGDATAAIAESLRLILGAMRDAGLIPTPGQQPAAQLQPQPAPAAQLQPQPAPAAQLQPQPAPAAQPQPAPAAQPQPQPAPAAQPQPQPFASVGAVQPVATPFAATSPAPAAPQPMAAVPAAGSHRPPSQQMKAQAAVPSGPVPQGGTVPVGPNGLPRLESEIGVHSETNFYTDFLGDIRNHGGIFIATFHVLPIGATCEVVLTFPGDLTAEFRGVVRWKREGTGSMGAGPSPGLGVEITDAGPEAWNLIDRFMRKREPMMHEM
jgi:hypothetical protein